jgi:hypothetical protein
MIRVSAHKEEQIMKKILSFGAMVFVLVGGILLGQQSERSAYPYKTDKNAATAVFAKKTYDDVWGATLKALIAEDYKATTSEKDAGIIKAVYNKSESVTTQAGYTTSLTRMAAYAQIAVRVEAQDDKVAVSLRWDRVEKFTLPPTESNGHDIFSALYDKIAELLYGKIEKK